MIVKVCSQCNIEKKLDEFHKWVKGNDGYKPKCKECRKFETNLYYQKNSIKMMRKSQEYRLNNPEKIKDGLKKYREKNSESLKEKKRIWSKSLEGKKCKQKYYKNNTDVIKEKVKIYRKNKPDKEIERRNSEKRKKYMINYVIKYRILIL